MNQRRSPPGFGLSDSYVPESACGICRLRTSGSSLIKEREVISMYYVLDFEGVIAEFSTEEEACAYIEKRGLEDVWISSDED